MIDKINKFSSKIGKGKFSFILIVFILIVIMGLYQTFSLFTQSEGISYSNNTKTYTFIIGDTKENEIAIDANDSKYIDISIKNDKGIDLSYALYYNLDNASDDVLVGYLKETSAKPNDTIKSDELKIISLKVINNSDKITKIKIGINSGTTKGGELKQGGTRVTEEITNLDKSESNKPELDNNLIPVYYNEETNKWYKADESNSNKKYKWYDYSNKEWANAIIVNENTRNNYLNEKPGTLINDQDILAFFVWIPRYKYQVWNINREINDNNSYDALNKGINIKFESGITSTGNLICTYNKNSDETLKDNCNKTNEDEEIWYTHPAFTYGEKELTGFWIGKYETTGTLDKPTILPNNLSIRNINISGAFNISKVINTYKVNSNIDAHLLKNTEWGAVTYLTHSIYGICDEEKCIEISNNNSTKGITGRSSGSYENIDKNEEGNYTYNGYLVDNDKEKDLTKIASSTKNIYGVYDLSGGLSEYVMANMETSNKTINIQKSGNTWNKTNHLSNKYYNIYAYGETTNDNNAFKRAILGDATIEVTINNDNKITTWNNRENKEISFVNKDNAWLVRGGSATSQTGIFSYTNKNGDKDNDVGFRISLS